MEALEKSINEKLEEVKQEVTDKNYLRAKEYCESVINNLKTKLNTTDQSNKLKFEARKRDFEEELADIKLCIELYAKAKKNIKKIKTPNGITLSYPSPIKLWCDNEIRERLAEKLILPFKFPQLFPNSSGYGPLLLYGPDKNSMRDILKHFTSLVEVLLIRIDSNELLKNAEPYKDLTLVTKLCNEKFPCVILFEDIDAFNSKCMVKDDKRYKRAQCEMLVILSMFSSTKKRPESILFATATSPWLICRQELRRLTILYFVDLPDKGLRQEILKDFLTKHKHNLSEMDTIEVADMTEGYTSEEISNSLCLVYMKVVNKIITKEVLKEVILKAPPQTPVFKVELCRKWKES